MNKRRKIDSEWCITPLLPDSLTLTDPELVQAVVVLVRDKQVIARLVRLLQDVIPLPERWLFLKRVRNRGQHIEVLLSVDAHVDQVQALLAPHLKRLDLADDQVGPMTTAAIPKQPPLTRMQFQVARDVWPCHFHEDRNLESLLAGTRPDIWGKQCLDRHVSYMQQVLANGMSIVAQAAEGRVVAEAAPRPGLHPLQHAAMMVIDAVAHAHAGGAWKVPDPPRRDPNCTAYLLTGYDVYLKDEPCCMCAMALVHSRARRVFFNAASTHGALGTLVQLHSLSGLNHSYEVFRVWQRPI